VTDGPFVEAGDSFLLASPKYPAGFPHQLLKSLLRSDGYEAVTRVFTELFSDLHYAGATRGARPDIIVYLLRYRAV
jgi:hypothetical protein